MKSRAPHAVLTLAAAALTALLLPLALRDAGPRSTVDPAAGTMSSSVAPGATRVPTETGPPQGIEPHVVPTTVREVEPRLELAPGVEELLPHLTYTQPPPVKRNGAKARAARPTAREAGAGEDAYSPLAPAGEFGFGWEAIDSTATGSFPADPHGAVGPNHVMNVVNVDFQIWDKQGVLQSSGSLFSFFSPLSTSGVFDPRVLYDRIHERWVVISLELSQSVDSTLLAAVSDDDDPMGTWYIQEVPAHQSSSGGTWADFPTIGVDEEAVYVTTNQFTFGNPASFYDSQIFVLEKGSGTGGWYDGGAASVSKFNPPVGGSANFTLQATEMHAAHPNPTIGTYFASYNGATSGTNKVIRLFTLSNPLTSPLFTLELINIGNADQDGNVPNGPQPSGLTALETNKRSIEDAVWQDNRLYLTSTLRVSSQATAHWFRLNTTTQNNTFLNGQGNLDGEDIAPDTHTFYPSIEVTSGDDLGFGFAASGTNLFVGAYFSYRLADLTQGSSQVVRQGDSGYVRIFNGRNRWGDYSGIDVDPVDDCLWVYNMWAKTASVWGTAWGKYCLDFACGDGNIEPGETCDPPGEPAGLPEECRVDCRYCGDGTLEPAFEDCDDGNNVDGDGCGSHCFYELCGNGATQIGETCDSGGVETGAPDDCRFDCTFCGDGNQDTATTGDISINGDFELGVFHGWSVIADGSGTFFIDQPSSTTPFSDLPTVGGFGAGSFYAVSDSNGLGRHGIQQSFIVPSYATSVRLKFRMFANSYDNVVIDPAGLEWDIVPNQNQHSRVDLLNPGYPDFATNPEAVVANYYIGADAGANPNIPTNYNIDITGDVVPGETYVVRFAEATNLAVMNLGVNLVEIEITAPVSEECDDGNNVGGDTCTSSCELCTTAPFGQTVLALDGDTFFWGNPADVFWAVGDLDEVASYLPTSTGSAAFTTSIDVTGTPAPNDGVYFVLRPHCPGASWSSGGDGQCCTRPLP